MEMNLIGGILQLVRFSVIYTIGMLQGVLLPMREYQQKTFALQVGMFQQKMSGLP